MDDVTQEQNELAQPSTWTERGASLVEYALLMALIAVVCIGALTFFGESTGSALDDSGQSIFLPQ